MKLKLGKTLDRYIFLQIIPPFLVAFLVALFVLTMQILWIRIDKIIGKGIHFFEILEMVLYMVVALVPRALPLGILIACVMLFGGLSERYELASMKSAGMSLMRILRSSLIFGVFVACISYYFSNNLIPVANLKFQTRLYDISNQRPALNLEEKIFNDDFSGYAIQIDRRDPDGKTIYDVMLYDHSNARSGEVTITTSKSGEMFTTLDEQYLIMRLFDGYQFQDIKESGKNKTNPIIQSKFDSLTKIFDLGQFEFSKTDEERYKDLEQMLSIGQLMDGIDTLEHELESSKKVYSRGIRAVLEPQQKKVDTKVLKGAFQKPTSKSNGSQQADTDIHANRTSDVPPTTLLDSIKRSDVLDSFYSRWAHLKGEGDVKQAMIRAKGRIVGAHNAIRSQIFKSMSTIKSIRKHKYYLHRKFSTAAICIVFVFIGVPLGAIIRKGGYGLPLLVSVSFFILHEIMRMISEDMYKTDQLIPELAAWFPVLILAPFGLYLTHKASVDSRFSALSTFVAWIKRTFSSVKNK